MKLLVLGLLVGMIVRLVGMVVRLVDMVVRLVGMVVRLVDILLGILLGDMVLCLVFDFLVLEDLDFFDDFEDFALSSFVSSFGDF